MSGAGALSLVDLNSEVNHEPRILDVRVGERLGFDRPRDIRQLIDRNREELEAYGPLAARHRKSRGQEFTEYWLNEGQTLLLCMFSRTPAAAAVRREVIEVFMAYRRGLLAPASITAIEDQEPPQRLCDRFAQECARLGFETPEAFAKAVGWRGNKLFNVMTMETLPRKIEDIWLLLGLGFDVPYIKWGRRSAILRAPALLQTWRSLPPERRALLLGDQAGGGPHEE